MVYKPGQTLTDAALNAGDENKVVFIALRAVAQAQGNGVDTPLSWDTVTLDTLTGWAVGTPTRYTPSVPGWYKVSAKGSWATASSTSYRHCAVAKNAVIVPGGRAMLTSAWGAAIGMTMTSPTIAVACNGSTDYIEIHTGHNHGSAVNTDVGVAAPIVTITYGGAL